MLKNQGAPGVDGVSFARHRDRGRVACRRFSTTSRRNCGRGRYRPQPVRRVYIPKPDGRLRPLGIPTVRDRVAQMAVLLVIEPIFEADFEDCSFGFRPGRNAHQALDQIQAALKAGRQEVYDADLASYFDTIDHDRLMQQLERRIADRSVLTLIRLWLRCPRGGRTTRGDDARRTRGRGRRRAESSRRCWRTSTCTTSTGRFTRTTAPPSLRTRDWCGTPMTSWCWRGRWGHACRVARSGRSNRTSG